MKKRFMGGFTVQKIFFLLIVGPLLLPQAGFAASSSAAAVFCQGGSATLTNVGDYVSSSGGLGGTSKYYRYFIEVPAGLSNLYVDLFDGDVGAGTTNQNDWPNNIAPVSWNTSCVYSLYNPSGTLVGTPLTLDATSSTYNNVWMNFQIVANPTAGHWELRVSTQNTGDDINGYGVRAHDGTPGSGGTELPIYAESFLPLGAIGTGVTTTTTFYPYVTSGCTVDWNDFDGDTGTGGALLTYRSRLGTFANNYAGSGHTVWLNTPLTGFRTDVLNNDMGIWRATTAYTDTGALANFGCFWAGNWLAANGQPSAQPEANSFRLYLPTDSGSAPLKPYLTQKIVYVSGSNPPHHGRPHAATYMRVLINFVNPTAHAVTFSAANLVTANVPGVKVLYRGSAYAAVSQGSITAQPAIGGSGNITWNPGTVAAGVTSWLYYEVGVTPTVNDERIIVTGTPALNGTWARYLDETGNTTQTRATFTFGPLCELAVTEDSTVIPTWVAVSCFEACAEESQPTLEWHTGIEIGTVGFNLWRQDKDTKEYELVNPDFLPALPSSPQGGVYRLADPGAQFGEPVVYRLEEIAADGQTMSYGPFTVAFGAQSSQQETEINLEKKGREEPTDIYGYQRFNRERSLYEQERLQARRLVRQTAAAQAASTSKERVKITVKGRGLFYVNSAQIANSLGVDALTAEALISGQNLNMTNRGKNIAWLADSNGAGIFFYNDGNETVFSGQNVFWLERGRGLAMETIGAGNAGAASADQAYKETLHFEGNRYALMTQFMNPQGDIWFWDYVLGGGSAKSFPVNVPGPTGSGQATLTVTLQGATATAARNDHHAVISLNGSEIGDAWWDGTKAHTFKIIFNSSLLSEGNNIISVSGLLDMGAPYSIFYVEAFDLSYQRFYKAVDNTLLCRGDGNSVITVSGFSESQVVVLDVSNPERPKQKIGVAPDVSGRVTFVTYDGTKSYLVNGLNAALRPLTVSGDRPAQLKGSGHSAEYLVIAPEEFRETAQLLADYRKSKGMTAMVVTLEDIYESFSFGRANPLAVRDFLAYAYNRWNGRKVNYAVLIGKGTYDYKDYQGHGDNLFPVILAKTPEGLCAADKEFGNVNGGNGVPEIAIGRLPAVTNNELQTMIDKIKAYENGQGSWTGKALMIADNTDDGGDFAASSDTLASLATDFQVERIYMDNAAQAQAIRARIIAGFNGGAGLVNYCGHGALDQLAAEKIFSSDDMASLQNGSQLPLMVLLTCVAGRFEIPGNTCLAEALLLNENGGIAGGLAPSGAAMNANSLRLGEEFYKAAFSGRETNVGLAWLKAMKKYMLQGGKAFMLSIYNWLGDPALTFK